MTWQPNMTMTAKHNIKSSLFVEYGNLIKELEQYLPQFKVSIKDLQEPTQSFVTNFYTDILSEFFCDVNNLTEVLITLSLCRLIGQVLIYFYRRLFLDSSVSKSHV